MEIYKLKEVCKILDISEGTFYLWVKKEYIPKPLKNRRGHNVYTKDLLIKAQKYIEEMEYTLSETPSRVEEQPKAPKSLEEKEEGEVIEDKLKSVYNNNNNNNKGKLKSPLKANKPSSNLSRELFRKK